jgi:hypothetical protein
MYTLSQRICRHISNFDFLGTFAAEIPHLPRGSELEEIVTRKKSTRRVMNLMCLGGTHWLQAMFKIPEGINPVVIHQLILKEVVFESYKVSTNNSTLHTTYLNLNCTKKLYVESASCKTFFLEVIKNFDRSLILSLNLRFRVF